MGMKNDPDWVAFTVYVQSLEAWARSFGIQTPHSVVGIVPRLEEKFERIEAETKRLQEADMIRQMERIRT